MEKLSIALLFFVDVSKNLKIHGDIFLWMLFPLLRYDLSNYCKWPLIVIKFFRKCCIWWTKDDPYSSRIRNSLIFYSLIGLNVFFYSDSSIYFSSNFKQIDKFYLLTHISLVITGLAASAVVVEFHRKKKVLYEIAEGVQLKHLQLLKQYPSQTSFHKSSNRIFIVVSFFFFVTICFTFLATLMWIIDFIRTGNNHFPHTFMTLTPFSFLAWTQQTIHSAGTLYIGTVIGGFLSVVIECVLRLSLHIRSIADNVSRLRMKMVIDEDQELSEFKQSIAEYNLCISLVAKLNGAFRVLAIITIFISVVTIGIYLSVIFSLSGFVEIFSFAFVLCYQLVVPVLYCSLGEHLKYSVSCIVMAKEFHSIQYSLG